MAKPKKDREEQPQGMTPRLTSRDLGPDGRIGRQFMTKSSSKESLDQLKRVVHVIAKEAELDRWRVNALLILLYDRGILPKNAIHEKCREQLLDPDYPVEHMPALTLGDVIQGSYDLTKEEQLAVAKKIKNEEWVELIDRWHKAKEAQQEKLSSEQPPSPPPAAPVRGIDGDADPELELSGSASGSEDTASE